MGSNKRRIKAKRNNRRTSWKIMNICSNKDKPLVLLEKLRQNKELQENEDSKKHWMKNGNFNKIFKN